MADVAAFWCRVFKEASQGEINLGPLPVPYLIGLKARFGEPDTIWGICCLGQACKSRGIDSEGKLVGQIVISDC